MLYKAKAIVLGGRDIGEADKLLTLYSEEKGKIKAIAKGIRKTKSKFGSSLEPFTLSDLLIYSKNSSLNIITDAQIQNSFRNLHEDLSGFAYGDFLVELVDKMTLEKEQGGYGIFHLLKEFMSLFRYVKNTRVLVYSFTFRFFNILGYHPQIESCVQCGREIKNIKELSFSVEQGGILCNNCKKQDRVLPISISSLQYFKQLMKIDPPYLKNLRISRDCDQELENILQEYLNFYLGGKISSFSFLKQIIEDL